MYKPLGVYSALGINSVFQTLRHNKNYIFENLKFQNFHLGQVF